MSYKPAGYSQMDGSAFQRSNCVLATCTDLIDRATVAALRIPAPVLRTASGDTSGGVSYSQAEAATMKVTTAKGRPVDLQPRYGLTRAQVRDLAKAGYAFGISIWTGVTSGTRFRTGTFIGGHTVYVQGWAGGYFEVEDPGTTAAGYMLWPEDLLFRAAEARGGGQINVLVAPDTEVIVWKCTKRAEIRSQPTYADGIRRTYSVAGRTYKGGRTESGGSWARPDGSRGSGWVHVVISGTTPDTYKWGWIRGNVVVQA